MFSFKVKAIMLLLIHLRQPRDSTMLCFTCLGEHNTFSELLAAISCFGLGCHCVFRDSITLLLLVSLHMRVTSAMQLHTYGTLIIYLPRQQGCMILFDGMLLCVPLLASISC